MDGKPLFARALRPLTWGYDSPHIVEDSTSNPHMSVSARERAGINQQGGVDPVMPHILKNRS